jgi:hypothetical protein
MDTDAEGIVKMRQREHAVAAPVGEILGKPDTARSICNILQWTSYLPKACVKTMIKMGWDRNT